MKKKIVVSLISILMVMLLIAGCASNKTTQPEGNSSESTDANETEENDENEDNENSETSEETSENESGSPSDTSGEFIIEYPDDMKELGFTEPVVLDHVPENVVILTVAPVLAFYEMGANIVGVPNTVTMTWPEDLQAAAGKVQFSAMAADQFDAEQVVNLNADLVVCTSTASDTVGKTLEDLGITCYYTYSGHVVSYETIKMQTQAIVNAYSRDEESKAKAEEIMARFDTCEANCELAKEAFAGKTCMVLQSGGPESHYIQSEGGTLGSMMSMIGFTNVFNQQGSPMVQLDYEQALDYNPDVVVCVGGSDAESHKAIMEEAFSANPEYWNAIPAIAEGRVVYVSPEYVSATGINVVNSINNLIENMADFLDIDLSISK